MRNKRPWRPENQGMARWFVKLCQWLELEADAELYSLAYQDDRISWRF